MNREVLVPGPPGIQYEAAWGRKTVKSKTFIGRVYERVQGGGMQLWACDHQHPDEAEALDCAAAEAKAIAARELADYRPPDIRALRDAVAQQFGGMPTEVRDPRRQAKTVVSTTREAWQATPGQRRRPRASAPTSSGATGAGDAEQARELGEPMTTRPAWRGRVLSSRTWDEFPSTAKAVPVLAASLSGHSSATSGMALWLRLLTAPRGIHSCHESTEILV